MEYTIVAVAALAGGLLTLFSGFGLGTVLLAVFALFFPVGVAVAMTAVVHFLNNVFKFGLLGRHANWSIVLRFGLPAIVGAWLGARGLVLLTDMPSLASYELASREFVVTPVKLVVGVLLLGFAVLESLPKSQLGDVPARYLPAGGLLSGFFGGLSGHQGALRSMFLLKAGLTKEGFIATGIVIALLIDATRLSTYLSGLHQLDWRANAVVMTIATVAAFVGSFVGSRLLHKVTFRTVQRIVVVLLVLVAVGLISGLI